MAKAHLSSLAALSLSLASLSFAAAAAAPPPFPWPPAARAQAEALVASMDLASVLHMTSANQSNPYQGTIDALPRFGIPHIGNHDGPQGVCGGFTQATALPSEMAVAMTFDPAAAFAFGHANGLEHRIKGANVQLSPAVNIARVPWCGRLFEYLGEDPVLAAAMAEQLVLGIQSNNISGCIKHFILNSQETQRHNVSSNVDRRTFMELYTPAFEAGIKAGVGSVMCSYNRINGSTWACENAGTQEDLLRGRWGFQGFLRSDGHDLWETAAPANNGCDQEMPNTGFFGPAALGAAIANGSVTEVRVREMVTRQLTTYFALNIMQDPLNITDRAPASNVARVQLARQIAVAATVLLKNAPPAGAAAPLLPVDVTKVRSIAVFGDELSTEGGGSGNVVAEYTITPTQGIYAAVNGGLGPPSTRPNNSCTLEPNTDYDNPSTCMDGVLSVADCCNVCTADPTCIAFSYHPNISCAGPPPGNRCWLKNSLAGKRTLNGVTAGLCPPFPPLPPGPSGVAITYGGADPATAPALAAAADLAVVVVATTSSEGADRPNLSLDAPYDALAAAIIAAQPNTVVVVRCPGPCLMPWLAQAPAVFFQGMAGQEAGNALADVLFGVANPAGRLVHSFPASETDTWIQTQEQYPGTVRADAPCCFPQTDFTEKLEVGYRWYDAQGTSPLFPFGFGLSYTSFTYSDLQVTGVSPAPGAAANVSVTVTNSGSVAGAEVAQLYVSYPAAAGEPPQLLRAFKRTWPLAPGESVTISWELQARAFSIFDVVPDDYVVVPGQYQLRVGAGSRDIRLTASITL